MPSKTSLLRTISQPCSGKRIRRPPMLQFPVVRAHCHVRLWSRAIIAPLHPKMHRPPRHATVEVLTNNFHPVLHYSKPNTNIQLLNCLHIITTKFLIPIETEQQRGKTRQEYNRILQRHARSDIPNTND